MEAWVGLAGVVAGALIAFSGQYFTRRSEVRERNSLLLLEQVAVLAALSEDYRNRVWEERNQVASNVVATWDYNAYHLTEARLRILCREPDVLSAPQTLDKSGATLVLHGVLSPEMKVGSRRPGRLTAQL